MTQPSLLSIVRTILSSDGNLTTEEVIKRVRARGLKSADQAIKKAVYNVRTDLKKNSSAPASASTSKAVDPSSTPTAAPKPGVDLTVVLSNVALVNAAVGASGGVDPTRQVAEAVRACGSVDAFLQHLELVAGIRSDERPS